LPRIECLSQTEEDEVKFVLLAATVATAALFSSSTGAQEQRFCQISEQNCSATDQLTSDRATGQVELLRRAQQAVSDFAASSIDERKSQLSASFEALLGAKVISQEEYQALISSLEDSSDLETFILTIPTIAPEILDYMPAVSTAAPGDRKNAGAWKLAGCLAGIAIAIEAGPAGMALGCSIGSLAGEAIAGSY
jgi:hypothetical protein